MIRTPTLSEANVLKALHEEAIRESCSAFYTEEQIAAWTAGTLTDWKLGIEMLPDYFVYEDRGQVDGFVNTALDSNMIKMLYVRPGAMGYGVGKLLLSIVEQRLEEDGHEAVKVISSLNAVTFYQKNGYEIVKEKSSVKFADQELPVTILCKNLPK